MHMKDPAGRSPSWGEYDTVVAGGGIAGATAAWRLARSGQRVLVVEPTGALGREISRSRLMWWDLPRASLSNDFADALHAQLTGLGGYFDGILDPVATALALDQMLVEAGIDVLFHVWPTTLSHGTRSRLALASAEGRSHVSVHTVVDASRRGRLMRAAGLPFPRQRPLSRLDLVYAGVPLPSHGVPGSIAVDSLEYGDVGMTWRPTFWPGEVRVTVSCHRIVHPRQEADLISFAIQALDHHAGVITKGRFCAVSDEVIHAASLTTLTGSRHTTADAAPIVGAWVTEPEGDLLDDDTYLTRAANEGTSAAERVVSLSRQLRHVTRKDEQTA